MVSISKNFQQPDVSERSKVTLKNDSKESNETLQNTKSSLLTNDNLKFNPRLNASVLPTLSIPDNETFISLKGLTRDELESTIKRFFPDAKITSTTFPDHYSQNINFESKGKSYELKFVHLTSCFGPTTSTTTIKESKEQDKPVTRPHLTDPKDLFKDIPVVINTKPPIYFPEIGKEDPNTIKLENVKEGELEKEIRKRFPDAKIISVKSQYEKDPYIVSTTTTYTKNIIFESLGKTYNLDYTRTRGCFGGSESATIKPCEQVKPNKKTYEISGSPETGINVSFPMGRSPGYETVIRDIFGNDATIKLGPVKFSHPIASMDFEVDGKKYNVTELVGGFAPSSGFTIKYLG